MKVVLSCLVILLIVILVTVFIGGILTILWNVVVPVAFNGPTLSLLQGSALVLLFELVGTLLNGLEFKTK